MWLFGVGLPPGPRNHCCSPAGVHWWGSAATPRDPQQLAGKGPLQCLEDHRGFLTGVHSSHTRGSTAAVHWGSNAAHGRSRQLTGESALQRPEAHCGFLTRVCSSHTRGSTRARRGCLAAMPWLPPGLAGGVSTATLGGPWQVAVVGPLTHTGPPGLTGGGPPSCPGSCWGSQGWVHCHTWGPAVVCQRGSDAAVGACWGSWGFHRHAQCLPGLAGGVHHHAWFPAGVRRGIHHCSPCPARACTGCPLVCLGPHGISQGRVHRCAWGPAVAHMVWSTSTPMDMPGLAGGCPLAHLGPHWFSQGGCPPVHPGPCGSSCGGFAAPGGPLPLTGFCC